MPSTIKKPISANVAAGDGHQDVHHFAKAEKGLRCQVVELTGRGARIRTADLLRPRQARYQTAPRPDRIKWVRETADVGDVRATGRILFCQASPVPSR